MKKVFLFCFIFLIFAFAFCQKKDESKKEEIEIEKKQEELYTFVEVEEKKVYYDLPIEKDIQDLVRTASEEAGIPFELALAVIWKETNFRNVMGDNSESYGYMQIQKKWHKDRMNRLGVYDLTDPLSNFRVGCDYLAELLEKYPLANALSFYNSGSPSLIPYCEKVMDYMEELEAKKI